MKSKRSRFHSKEILKEAGFNLGKFYSNSTALQAKINPDNDKKNPLLEENNFVTEKLELVTEGTWYLMGPVY